MRDGKGNQHLLVGRILFGDLSPLLEKERETVSYGTASVERHNRRNEIDNQNQVCW